MLRNSHGNNISEISYAVGFSNVSYFAKCFKEQYGVTPTEYNK
jgi:AraC-like DNA-binding protein